MGLVELSSNAADVLASSPIVMERMRIARYRLEVDVLTELAKLGADTSRESVQKIIDGLPEVLLNRELAWRTSW